MRTRYEFYSRLTSRKDIVFRAWPRRAITTSILVRSRERSGRVCLTMLTRRIWLALWLQHQSWRKEGYDVSMHENRQQRPINIENSSDWGSRWTTPLHCNFSVHEGVGLKRKSGKERFIL